MRFSTLSIRWVACILLASFCVVAAKDTSSNDENKHKSLVPFNGADTATLILAGVGLIIAAGGGIGGGGLLVPLFILISHFAPKEAIPLSNVTVLGGAIANTIAGAMYRHPKADRPLLDWSLVLIMEPMTIVGAVLGSFLNKVLPPIVITILLVMVLTALAHRSLSKGWKQYKKESGTGPEAMLIPSDRPKDTKALTPSEIISTRSPVGEIDKNFDSLPITQSDVVEGKADIAHFDIMDGKAEKDNEPKTELELLKEQERHIPLWKPAILTIIFIGIITLDILRGGTTCGSAAYWLVTLSSIPWVLGFYFFIRREVLREHIKKVSLGYNFLQGDVQWTPANTIKYPILCISAGLFAGVFGVGGGIVKGPLMLEMGVLPPVAAACSALMILYTSASACVTFYSFGSIQMDYAALYVVWGFLCTLLGQVVVTRLLRKYKKESFIVLSIGLVIFFSAILMAYQSIWEMINNPKSALEASALCS